MFEPEASRIFSGTSSHFNPILHTGSSAEKQDKDRREGKGHRCYLGDILECRTNHLAARMIWTKVFGRKSIWVGWWFGMVWTWWSSIIPKCPFFYSSISWNHPGTKCVVGHGIELTSSPKKRRRPLPSLLSDSFYMSLRYWYLVFSQILGEMVPLPGQDVDHTARHVACLQDLTKKSSFHGKYRHRTGFWVFQKHRYVVIHQKKNFRKKFTFFYFCRLLRRNFAI